ncbi:MAG: hypothetical protein JEZ14_07450 [Marinilabiliaceae bacterium]|nr:hypothetical protein [Marinilabiliaceae bacterium]
MEYYNNILCFPAHQYYHKYSGGYGKGEVVEVHFVSYSAYEKQVNRKRINIIRHGKGEGNYALIEFESIPPKYKELIRAKYGDVEKAARKTTFVDRVTKDYEALNFFLEYRYPDGSPIPTDKVNNINLWTNNASILNAIARDYEAHVKMRAQKGKRPMKTKFFNERAAAIDSIDFREVHEHNLPVAGRRLKEKFEEYVSNPKSRYETLVKNYVGNSNRLKINDNLLQLLAYIAAMPTRPYNTTVVQYYTEFMRGERELYDKKSGEVFNRQDYLGKNGEIIDITESAVWNRLNNPGKQVQLDKKRMGSKDFNDLHRPHRHRHNPEYSFSKISLDDRDLIWKDKTTKKRVKAYYAYDVASGCRIGSAYSMDKNEELFLDCLRDMFVFVDRHGFGIPMEVEVENHLVNKFFGDLEQMFPYLTVCAPGNSQQKRAEHFNRSVKYQVEKNNHPGVGRWWLKSKYNRISVDKVDDQFKQKMKTAERMIVDDIQDTLEYNNAPHPNQKKYPGMTRMEVLINNLNPALPRLNKSHIYRYIGFETQTSIERSMYLRCQYEKYMLPHPNVLEQLKANNREVTAYWVPDEEGSINEVYLYQDGNYICTCDKLTSYNEAKAERTEADDDAKLIQDKYVAMFDKWVKDEVSEYPKLNTLKVDPDPPPLPEPEVVIEEKQPEPVEEWAATDYSNKAFDDFLK